MDDWRKLFPKAANHSLDFYPPTLQEDGTTIVEPPPEVFEEATERWKHSIVAQFLTKPPNFSLLQRTITKLWEKKGKITITTAGPNLYIFKLENDEACTWILENGPWHIQHNTMILRKWEPNLDTLDFNLEKLPIWFHLHRVPWKLYSQKGISYIASAVGTPLYMDSITAGKKRLAFAKVCIEVSAVDDPPDSIQVKMDDRSTASVGVSIPWKPLVCPKVKNPEKQKQIWKPKPTEPITKESDLSLKDPVTHIGNDTMKQAPTRNMVDVSHVEFSNNKVHASKSIVETGSKATTELRSGICSPRETEVPVGEHTEPTSELLCLEMGVSQNKPVESAKAMAKGTKRLAGAGTESFASQKERIGKSPLSNSQKIIGSSTNKYAMLSNEEEEDELADIPDIGPSSTIWGQLIDNATFSPKKIRASAKDASLAWAGLMNTKQRIINKGNAGVPSSLKKKKRLQC